VQLIASVRTEVEALLTCGICRCVAVQAHRYAILYIHGHPTKVHSSMDCRHTYCATCIFHWWSRSGGTTCPICRAVCENTPVRDRSNGLVALLSEDPNQGIAPYDTDNFVVLMAAIKQGATEGERQEEEEEEEEAAEAAAAMELDGTGTALDPLDLTSGWE